MEVDKLEKILALHSEWLCDKRIGMCADLHGANLNNANLSGAHLNDANLNNANLSGANLYGASLNNARLNDANLSCANLGYANLNDAHLNDANLSRANLSGADLYGADLSRTNLNNANLSGAHLPVYQILPQEGGFVAFKKTTSGVVKLWIPSDAKRTSSLVGRKCRAEYVKVLEGEGDSPSYRTKLHYAPGKFIHADYYDNDIRIECAGGIHFFLTREEAEAF
jgi:hypothetical protein